MHRTIAILGAVFLPGAASALPPGEAAALFEMVRADLPCAANAKLIAGRFGFAPTGKSEERPGYGFREYGARDKTSFMVVSEEVRDGHSQNAASVSIYDTGEDYPADLTIAFSDIWDLPNPEPLRTDPQLAQFNWLVSFPNGPMQIIISNDPRSGLTQIYGRTLDQKEERKNGCSRQ